MGVLKNLIKDYRVLLYVFLVIFSIFYLVYAFNYTKVKVIESPILPNNSYVYSVDNCEVKDLNSLYNCIDNKKSFLVKTSSGNYLIQESDLPLLLNKTKFVEESKINKGIDLYGGIRVILKAQGNITYDELILSANVIEKRLNSYGLKSIDIRTSQDSYGNKYIIIDIPKSEYDLINLIKKEGKFEAKIGNETIITGKDILSIRDYPPYAGIDVCTPINGEWLCRFRFGIVISKDAANKFAEATKNLSVIFSAEGAYLSKNIEIYLDGKKVDELRIAADLKGKAVQEIQISGSGIGNNRDEAIENANKNMKELITILQYGSLPTTFEIVSIETIPPQIGKSILDSLVKVGVLALIAISILIIVVYRKLKPSVLIIFNMLAELVITLAIGILVGQTIDLPALAGIIIAIGTGIDDQIIAIEEILVGKIKAELSKKVWKILFIVVSSFITILFAMFPLLFAGLGLFKGFAVMTLIGAFIGAFITRPAFVRIAEAIL